MFNFHLKQDSNEGDDHHQLACSIGDIEIVHLFTLVLEGGIVQTLLLGTSMKEWIVEETINITIDLRLLNFHFNSIMFNFHLKQDGDEDDDHHHLGSVRDQAWTLPIMTWVASQPGMPVDVHADA